MTSARTSLPSTGLGATVRSPRWPAAVDDADFPPAILDIEASGLGTGSYPIEVGCVLPDGRAFCSLILPLPEWTRWDDAAEQLHHIDRPTLMRHGRPVEEVTRLLDEALGTRVVYSDGWNNDYSWLHALYEAAGRAPRFRLQSLAVLLTEDAAARWDDAKAAVLRRTGLPRHRASADARVLQLTLAEALQMAG